MDTIELKTFKNKQGKEIPYIEISTNTKFPQRFGIKKAKAIINNLDAIKKIIETAESSGIAPNQSESPVLEDMASGHQNAPII